MFKKWWTYERARIVRAIIETNWLKWFGGGFIMGLVADGARYEFGLRSKHDTIYFLGIAVGCAVIGALFAFLFKLFSLPAIMAAEQQEKLDLAIKANGEQSSQQKVTEVQNFEKFFFHQLELFKFVRQDVTLKYEQFGEGIKTYHGIECFSVAKNLMNTVWGDRKVDTSNMVAVEEAARTHYMSFHKAYREGLAQYFNTLYQLINSVASTAALDSDTTKRHYTGMVTTILNDNELFLLFYHGISPDAVKLRPLIEKYGLLEHLDKTLLLNAAHEHIYRDAYK